VALGFEDGSGDPRRAVIARRASVDTQTPQLVDTSNPAIS
jgi:hypothetical protein